MFGYGGHLNIDGSRVLCRAGGTRLSMPRNLNLPYPISFQKYGMLNYVDGLRFPVVQVAAIPMETPTSQWFTADNIKNWFMNRGAAPENDLSELAANIIFSDNGIVSGPGLGTFKVTGAKGAGWTLGFRQGQDVDFGMRFAGISRNATALANPVGGGLEGTPLNFARVVFGGGLASKGIVGGTLNFDTGLTPNPELNGTLYPTSHNVDLPTASLTLEFNVRSDVDAPGTDNAAIDTYAEFTGGIIAVKSIAAGTPSWIFFTIARGVITNPDDRSQVQGRVVRSFTYNLIATVAAYPVTVSQSAAAPV